MQVFHGKVRLQGSVTNEVSKRGLTVPEVIVLQKIHGVDGVVALVHAGNTEIDHQDERDRLREIYAQGLSALGDEEKTSIEKMFGGDYNPLPEKLRNFSGPLNDDVEEELEFFQQPEPFQQEDVPEVRAKARKAAKEAKAKAEIPATKPATKKASGVDAIM